MLLLLIESPNVDICDSSAIEDDVGKDDRRRDPLRTSGNIT